MENNIDVIDDVLRSFELVSCQGYFDAQRSFRRFEVCIDLQVFAEP